MLTMAKRKKPATPILGPTQIKAIREQLGLTQTQAAEKVGVSRRSWAAWEGGQQIPSPPLVILIQLLAKKKI